MKTFYFFASVEKQTIFQKNPSLIPLKSSVQFLFIPDQSRAVSDEVFLHDSGTYYSVVRATNLLGHVHVVRSNGITVKVEPLIPGVVRDGPIIGYSLNYQPGTTSLSANWDGFGAEYGNIRADGTFIIDLNLFYLA